ncbi:tetratricopeptide repeat protein [Stakelama tenebrarum]|uniref:Uncharacterized protein n=1 Tax=Stakelama tenebrarum TaxID=2711215 RepID=A0A6G6Y5Q7_9SPHN|nr:hypothetical protein [Sphingosinithalassobacter tenebrarum]QIG79923.1 hypothetical protein G5C33_09120 [Sphingosinithalassobacter tenebrarum]
MNFVSRFAVAAALGVSVAAISVSPANAQRSNGGEQEQPQVELSREFREPAAQAQELIAAKKFAEAEAPLAQAESIASNDDEHYYADWMRFQVELGQGNDDAVIPVLDRLIANPKLPASSAPVLNYERGRRSVLKEDYEGALPYLLKARELGYDQSALPLLIASSYFKLERVEEGAAALEHAVEQEKAKGNQPPADWYRMAISKLYNAEDMAGTARWLLMELETYPTAENWRRTISLYRQGHSLPVKQKLDMYRVMAAAGALADEAEYVGYADAAFNAGLPWETVSAIEAGRASGEIAESSDPANQLYSRAKTAVRNERALSAYESEAAAAADGDSAAQTGDAYLASGNYAKAIELYEMALDKGGVETDEVNLHLGIAHAKSGDLATARTYFDQVGSQGTYADFAKFWTVWIDTSQQQAAAPAEPATAAPVQ